MAYGVDETIDMYEAHDITVQWSIIGESQTQGHPEGEHNYGLINGPDGQHASIHHNLWAHHKNRCPAIANGPSEVIGNVAYDVRHGFVNHNPSSGPFNITGNYYKRGSSDDIFPFFFDGAAGPMLSYFLEGNYVDDPEFFVGVVDNPWIEPWVHPSFEYLSKPESVRADTIHDFSGQDGWEPITDDGWESAYDDVLDRAGAFPRDVLDLRMIDETMAGTGSWGAQFPGDLLEGLTPGAPPEDGDGDGIPDAWEDEHGTDPADGSDHDTVMPSGYTAIEVYINCLADGLVGEQGVDCGMGDPTGTDSDASTGGDSDASTGDDSASSTGDGTTGDSVGTTAGTGDSANPGTTGDNSGTGPLTETGDETDGGGGGSCGCRTDDAGAPWLTLLAACGLLGLRRRRE